MKTRFLKSVLRTAASQSTDVLPYSRGARRAAFIAKRKAPPLRKTA
ncbi:MAG: hypothetical protein AAGF60_03070 [Pseudomonadota bacterium]